MPANASKIFLEHESLRLGMLWRSQGEEFLREQAEIITADVNRLRDLYVAGLGVQAPSRAKAAVIDLRGEDVSMMGCSRDGHVFVKAAARCSRCRNVFCEDDIVRPKRMRGDAICTECALVMAGVNHNRLRPLVAPGRPGRALRRR